MTNNWTNILVSTAPFLLLLALWFFLLRRMQARQRETATENPFGPPQPMNTSDIAAELRSLRQSIEALRTDVKALNDRVGR